MKALTPREHITNILKTNGIKVRTKIVQIHQGMGYFARGGRDTNKFEARIFVSDYDKAKELLTKDMFFNYEQFCLVRYGNTTVKLYDMKYYNLMGKNR